MLLTNTAKREWRKLPVPLSELCINTVLRCGQSFRWRKNGDEWSCALSARILTLKQTPTHLLYHAIPFSPPGHPSTEDLLRDYFQLDISLSSLYQKWASADPHFQRISTSFGGIRMLRQDPWENLISFICSSNNNISRISGMVQALCSEWGMSLGSVDIQAPVHPEDGLPLEEKVVEYYDFPPPEKLCGDEVEGRLRKLGFGYRAGYIAETAKMVNEKGLDWLMELRKRPYQEVKEELVKLKGVGPKVADCVALMSLDKKGAVPVDTHVLQIAQRDYGFGKTKNKTLTAKTYDAIGEHFRNLWGEEAGWAHSVLFTADLKSFSEQLVKTKTETTSVSVKKERVVVKKETGTGVEGEVKEQTRTTKRVRVKVEVREEVKEEIKEEFKEKIWDDDVNGVPSSLAERVKRRRR
ncbi:DNA glycosylase [Pyronema omphalodes]|nr:DNA glycosylase [Pyronema omphalodes]